MEELRITAGVEAVLAYFLANLTEPVYGYALMRATGQPSSRLYPILTRLVAAGFLVRRWEDADPSAAGRPRRRLYSMTPDGTEAARVALARHRQSAASGSAQGSARVVPQGGTA